MDKRTIARTKYKLKKRIICRKCCIAFENKSQKYLTNCPKCGRIIDARIRTEQSKIYNKKHPNRNRKFKQYLNSGGKRKELGKIFRLRFRKTILNILSKNNPICVSCGCDKQELLEINHKNGGGTKEVQRGKKGVKFYWDIYMGRRKTDDLEILCRVCNAKHYLELKYGKLPYRITYK